VFVVITFPVLLSVRRGWDVGVNQEMQHSGLNRRGGVREPEWVEIA
jgi:hypothetical protein